MSDETMLRLGARIAEIEALYACVLETRDPAVERRLLAELAEASSHLATETASLGTRAKSGSKTGSGTSAKAGGTGTVRPKLRRRIIRTQRTADWIIARTTTRRPR